MQIGANIARNAAKALFFDRAAVTRHMDPKTARYLRRVGGYIRKTARNSIKKPGRMTIKEMRPEQRRRFARTRDARGRFTFGGRAAPPKPRRRASSKPGDPPLNQTGRLRDNIFFFADPKTRKSVVVGPVKLNKSTNAPAVLEHGGVSTITTRRGGRRLARYEKRPYMAPALERGTSRQNTIRFWREASAA